MGARGGGVGRSGWCRWDVGRVALRTASGSAACGPWRSSVRGEGLRMGGLAVLDGDALELGVVVEGLDALLPAVAALLVPTEGRLHGTGGPGVDEHLPGL